MFIRSKEYDELNARIVELARENKELKELRLQEVKNNTKILEQNNIKTDIIKRITDLVTSNTYGNEDVILRKIRELVRPLNQN